MARKKEESSKEEPKYGVDELVEATGLQATSIRVALRGLGVKKNYPNKYGWDTKKDFDQIVGALKERSAKRVVGTKVDKEKPTKRKGLRSKKAA